MFDNWKARRAIRSNERAAQKEAAERAEKDDYLRRLRNSAKMLTGTTHSGHNCDDTLKPWEISGVLRREFERLSKPATTRP